MKAQKTKMKGHEATKSQNEEKMKPQKADMKANEGTEGQNGRR